MEVEPEQQSFNHQSQHNADIICIWRQRSAVKHQDVYNAWQSEEKKHGGMLWINKWYKVCVAVAGDDFSSESHQHAQYLEKRFHWHFLQSPTQEVTREHHSGGETGIALLALEVATEWLDNVPHTEDNEKCARQSVTPKAPHGDSDGGFWSVFLVSNTTQNPTTERQIYYADWMKDCECVGHTHTHTSECVGHTHTHTITCSTSQYVGY